MTKAAVSLISLEPKAAQGAGGQSTSQNVGLLAALVYDSLGDLLSQIQDSFQPVELHRASTAQEVAELIEKSDTALLFADMNHPDDAFQLLLTLKTLKAPIDSGQIRVFVNCTIASKTFMEKLRAYGCSEIVSGVDRPEWVVQRARMMAELLLFRRAVSRLPGGKLSSIGLAFMLSEWVAQHGIDYSSLAHLFCACLSATCDGARFEFLQKNPATGTMDCIASNDSGPSQWLDVMKAETEKTAELRVEWIGDKKGALVCSKETELSAEQERLLQAAADLAAHFVLLDQPNITLKNSGLKC